MKGDTKIMYSIIIPTYNNLKYLIQAVNSVFLHTKDFEVIVVDNGSHDGTKGYLEDVNKRVKPSSLFKVISNEKNIGFAPAINQGIKVSKAHYVILLNNDVIVTPNWADNMVRAKEALMAATEVGKIGLVGPASNYTAGRQHVADIRYSMENIDEVAVRFHTANKNHYMLSGYLSGFCLMIDRNLINEIGLLDERFIFGGYEDNDYIVRAQRVGYKAMIAGDTFIHHFGSRTLDLTEFQSLRRGVANRSTFYNKWAEIDKIYEAKKLVAIYRTKDEGQHEYFQWSLRKTQSFVNEIIVLCDNCTDEGLTARIAKSFNSEECPVHIIEKDDGIFNERNDRNLLIKKAKELNADWIISIDGDEVFEDKFDKEYVQKLMNPINPEICCYGFHWFTFFEGTTHWRVDGIFGRIRGWRMFRNIPKDESQKIILGNDIGLHCGNVVQFPPENCRWTNVRIKHYGYSNPDICKNKRNFYENIDLDKREDLIGADDYAHLTPDRMSLMKWKEANTLSFAVIASSNEEAELLGDLLDNWKYISDEIVVVITDPEATRVEEIAKIYTNKIYYYKWTNDFSAARNFLKSKCASTWIMTMDPDEAIVEHSNLHIVKMTEMDTDGFMFKVRNIQKGGAFSISEAVRLYRNIPEFKYTGLVHENFDFALWDKSVHIMNSPLNIEHYGYLKTDEQVEKKLEQYEKLNRLQIKQNPKDCRPYFNLALHYRNSGNIERAKSLLLQAIKINPKFVNAIRELGFILVREGTEWFKHGRDIASANSSVYQYMNQLVDNIEGVIGKEELSVGKARQRMIERFKAADESQSKLKNIVENIAVPGIDRDNSTKLSFIGEQYQKVEI